MPSTHPPSPTPDSQTEPVEPFVLTLPDDPASGNDWYLWAGVLALLVFVVFFPAINGDLLWDDDHYVGLISLIPSLHGLAQIWADPSATPQYYPLTFTSFWIEHRIWADNTLGYHLDNLLLHAGCAVLIWRLLRRLRLPGPGASPSGAWLAATIWAIHPLQAESVCWMSERKNVLSGLLFFASIWFYLEYAGLTPRPKRRWPGLSVDGSTVLLGNRGLAYAVSWSLFVLALLAKSVACVMPAVMLILLWWEGRKVLDRKTLLPLIPFFLGGLAMSAVTVYLETSPGGNVAAEGPDWAITPIQRLLIAGRGVWFYVAKLLWPAGLAFSYPRILPSPESLGAPVYAIQWLYVVAAALLLTFLWLGRKRLGRGPLAALLFYGVCIFPALGFINIYPMRYSFVADHFQYMAGLGLIVLLVAAASRAISKLKIPPAAGACAAAFILVLLAVPAWMQAHIYESPIALWQDTLAKNPDSWMAAHDLGTELIKLAQQERKDAADSQAQGDPDTAAADTKAAQDNLQEAEQLFDHALALHPSTFSIHTSLGVLYELTGRLQQAETELRTAVDMDDQEPRAHQLVIPYLDYARLIEQEHPDIDVGPWLVKAMELASRPRTTTQEAAGAHLAYGDYWLKRSDIARRAGKPDEEIADLNQAVSELNIGLQAMPDSAASLLDLGLAYQRMGVIDQQRSDAARAAGRIDEAQADLQKSLSIDDAQAVQSFLSAAAQYPSDRYAPALMGIGEVTVRHIIDRNLQSDYVHDLLVGMQFFKDARQIDPTVPQASENLAAISRQLMNEGLLDEAHEATWTPLRQKLQALLAAGRSRPAIATDAVAHDALWPLARAHPLFQPLVDLRLALRAYLSDSASDVAATDLRQAAQKLLAAWNQRVPVRDMAADAIAAATCYEGAVTADERSAFAWIKLRDTANVLQSAIAAHNDAPGLTEALAQARSVLDQRRSATQPATEPSDVR